ncbi:hypothetical protein, partial [Streptomyces luteogriseus]|uniref:hypothetical protein n=1 Tax=Streptomyces luteogriseus TaxID=68233 RepID=UPI0037BC7751
MQNPSQGPRASFNQSDHPSDPTADWAILTGWLVAAREQISQEQARDADSWICDSLGIKHKDLVQAAGFVGHPDAPNVTLNEAVERAGGDPLNFTLSTVMLCGCLVATAGEGNPDWLKQFDLTPWIWRAISRTCTRPRGGAARG